MAETKKLLDKVKKLFSLAGNNPSSEESKAAMMKAQQLLKDGGMSLSDVDLGEGKREVLEQEIDLGTVGIPPWKGSLMKTIALNFRCDTYILQASGTRWKRIILVGVPQDVQVVQFIFEKALAAAETGFKSFVANYQEKSLGSVRHVRRLKNDYCFSFIMGLSVQFVQNIAIHDLHPVIVQPLEVQERMGGLKLKKGKAPRVRGTKSSEAKVAGFRAGERFNMNPEQLPEKS